MSVTKEERVQLLVNTLFAYVSLTVSHNWVAEPAEQRFVTLTECVDSSFRRDSSLSDTALGISVIMCK